MGRGIQPPSIPQPTPNIQTYSTSHPRIAHGQRYPMPCLGWSSEVVEWEQGSGPRGPMSCKTQEWISRWRFLGLLPNKARIQSYPRKHDENVQLLLSNSLLSNDENVQLSFNLQSNVQHEVSNTKMSNFYWCFIPSTNDLHLHLPYSSLNLTGRSL